MIALLLSLALVLPACSGSDPAALTHSGNASLGSGDFDAALSDFQGALDAIAGSIEHRERGGRDLAAALASPDLDADAPVIVFCPAREGEWTAALARMSGREPGRFTFVVCCDEAVSPESAEAWERWVLRPRPPRSEDEASSSALAKRFKSAARRPSRTASVHSGWRSGKGSKPGSSPPITLQRARPRSSWIRNCRSGGQAGW